MVSPILKAICPPVVAQVYHKIKHKKLFFGVYETFEEAPDENAWDDKGWINVSRKKLDDLFEISRENGGLLPKPILEGYTVLPCLVMNMLCGRGKCRVMDFAGGTGFVYYRIRPYLMNPANVVWDVVDSNESLLEIGRKSQLKDDSIQFLDRLPPPEGNLYDAIYINTALQYIPDYEGLLNTLFSFEPSYLILTRLMSGDVDTFITSQMLCGKRVPCKIINFNHLIRIISAHGYEIIFKSPAETNFENYYDQSIPKQMQIPCTINVIFMKT